MTNKHNHITKTYLKELRQCFPVFNAPEKRFYTSVKNSVEIYSAENPNFSKKTLVKNIGEPKEIASRYLLDIDTETLYKSISFSRRIRTIAFVILFIILIAATVKIHLDYKAYKETKDAYIDREIHQLDEN